MHTPGPWFSTASCADGTMITDDKGAQIALWPPQGGTVEQCANARLLAAAPDLLALARQYANDMRYPPADDSRKRRLAAIETVLSRLED